ncbi:hypothetical protein ARUE_232p00840 (plasmid) [Arthrobacter sp. Rue61a]|nr:hypothetical protein ARUE_232p00840 [Arthrobacter sp. Rue61a]
MPSKAVKGILATSASPGVTLFEPKLAGYRIKISEQKDGGAYGHARARR